MVRVQAARLGRKCASSFPIARISGEEAKVRLREAIHRIQSHSPGSRDLEGVEVLAKELDGRQGMKRKMIRGRYFHRTLGRR